MLSRNYFYILFSFLGFLFLKLSLFLFLTIHRFSQECLRLFLYQQLGSFPLDSATGFPFPNYPEDEALAL